MRTSRSPTNLVLVAFGALLIAGGVVVTFAELRPFLRASDTPPARMLTLAEGKTEHGFSTSARQLFLFDCRSAIISLFARIQTEAVRRSLNQNCLSASDRLAAEQPTFSIAWLTGALAASQLEDWDGFNLRLEHSQRTGPTEQWIAQIRVSIAEHYFDQLSAAAKAGNLADMVLMSDTDPGLLELARIYVTVPSSRERITAVINGTSEITQEKFVRRVRMQSSDAEV